MKTTYLKITTSLLLLAGLNSSCDGCNDRKADDADGTTTNVNVETTDGDGAYDEASGANGNNTSGTRANETGKVTKAGTKPGSDGYSAADGTDAENHDGDMYTKHDTTPQASGPPIK